MRRKKMTTRATTCTCTVLLTLWWTVATALLSEQRMTRCRFLETEYARHNLRNVTVGMSDGHHQLQLALAPLLAQPRVSGTAGNHRARAHITDWMRTLGWTVEEDRFQDSTPYGPRPFSNVVATLDPGRPRRVVLACHYDSKLMVRRRRMYGGSPPRPFVGATDSAVPCALLMASAGQLRQVLLDRTSSSSSNLTLQFVFFDGEEAFLRWGPRDSLYGARHLARKWADMPDPSYPGLNHLQTIDYLILLDLIGTADTHFKKRFYQTTEVYNKLQNIEICLMEKGYLQAVGNVQPLFTSQAEYNVIEDDHLPFLQKGVPVVHLITSPFPRVWHTSYDNQDALSFPRIDSLARVLRAFLADLPL